MVIPSLDRRQFVKALLAAGLVPSGARAEEFIDLNWTDLVPEGQVAIPPILQSLIDHTQDTLAAAQPQSMGVREDWNGQVVRLPGFIVPIEYSGTGVSAFILVPFVGACVHVPPPPANQLVFVTTLDPFESTGLYQAVNVTGMFSTASMSTQLADIAYALSADHIEPFKL